MIEKSFDSIIPSPSNLTDDNIDLIKNFNHRLEHLIDKISVQDITGYIKNVWELISLSNKFFNDSKPWELKKNNENEYKNVLYVTANLIKQIGILINPIMPETSEKILYMLNINDINQFHQINDIDISGIKLNEITPLFPRVDK